MQQRGYGAGTLVWRRYGKHLKAPDNLNEVLKDATVLNHMPSASQGGEPDEPAAQGVRLGAPSGAVNQQTVALNVIIPQGAEGGLGVAATLPLAVPCVQLALEIIACAERVVANHARCSRLVDRINIMLPFLKQLSAEPESRLDDRVKALLLRIQMVLEDTHACVMHWCPPNDGNGLLAVVGKLLKSQWYQSEFIQLNERLSNHFNDLALALNIMHRAPQQSRDQLDKENIADARLDLTSLASLLVSEDGQQVWQQMSDEDKGKLQEVFEGCQLNLTELRRQAGRDQMNKEVKDLMIPMSNVQIVEEVGNGGFGRVFRGRWEGVDVAVKMLHVGLMSEYVQRGIQREAYLMHKVQGHPNICGCFGLIIQPPTTCGLVLEYHDQGSLDKLIYDHDVVLVERKRIQMALDIARGMKHLHNRPEHPIVHGDLKPSNMLLTDKGGVVISDFGLSRITTYTLTTAYPRSAASIQYMAPELLVKDGSRSKEGDMYAFAVTLLELLVRQPPYSNADYNSIFIRVQQGHRPSIPSSVNPQLAALIRCCWDHDPILRPTFVDVVAKLELMLQ